MNFKSFWNKCPAGSRRSRWKPCTGYMCCISIWGKELKLKAEDPGSCSSYMTICYERFSHPKPAPYKRHDHELVEGLLQPARFSNFCQDAWASSSSAASWSANLRNRLMSPRKRVEVTSKVGKHKFVFHLVTEKVEVKINRDSLTNNLVILVVTLTRSGTCLVISTHQIYN